MPRLCILCGKGQSHSFSVFSFPSSVRQRNAWLKVILEVNPDFMKDKKLFANNRLKNGVCESHFLLNEISNGKKRRLDKNAVPSLSIPISPRCNTIVRKYNSLLRRVDNVESLSEAFISADIDISTNDNISNDLCYDSSLPDCTIEMEDKNDSLRIYKSVVNDLTEENKGYCLCCGSHSEWKYLYSVSKLNIISGSLSMLDEMVDVFGIPQERITMFSYLKRKLFSNINSDDFNENSEHVIIEDEKSSSIEDEKHSITLKDLKVKEGTFPCIDCPEKFESLTAFCTHLAIHEKDEITSHEAKYSCPNCDQIFLTKAAISFHKKSHQPSSSGQECDKRIATKNRTYKRTNKTSQKVSLRSSSETLNSEDKLRNEWLKGGGKRNHMVCQKRKTYAKSVKNICEKCGEDFSSSSKLNTHICTKHQDVTMVCHLCNANFTSLSLYKKHLALNHKNKLFSCDSYESEFTEKDLAKQHPLKCPIKNSETNILNSDINTSYNERIVQTPDVDSSELMVVNQEVYSNKENESTCVLSTSDQYESNHFRKFDLPPEIIKDSKIIELSKDKILPFSDNTLENHSVMNNDIDFEKDVSVVNVHMLDGIEVQHIDVEESIKNIDKSENHSPLNIIHVLESDIKTSNANVQIASNLHSKQDEFHVEVEDVGVQSISSPLPTSEITDDHVVHLIEPLLNQSDLSDISDSLQPTKNNWNFPNSIEHSDSSVNHAVHSLNVLHEVAPPVTREIDINVPSDDDEAKVKPLSTHPRSELGAHDLPSFSVDISKKGDVRYVMYFENPLNKS